MGAVRTKDVLHHLTENWGANDNHMVCLKTWLVIGIAVMLDCNSSTSQVTIGQTSAV